MKLLAHGQSYEERAMVVKVFVAKSEDKLKIRSEIKKKKGKIKREKVEWLLLQKRDCMKLATRPKPLRARHCSLVDGLVLDLVLKGKSLQFSRRINS